MEDRRPTSTDKVLYVDATWANETWANLTQMAMDHFGLTQQEVMDRIRLSVENIQVSGCLCHYDPSDWANYFVFELLGAETVDLG